MIARDDVVVTGLGLVTPAGVGADTTWTGLMSGTPTAAHDDELADAPVTFSCRVPDTPLSAAVGPAMAWRADRFILFALAAAREAVTDARLAPSQWDGTRVGVVIGSGGSSHDTTLRTAGLISQGRHRALSPTCVTRSQPNMPAGFVAMEFGATGPTFGITTACASGATALGMAAMLIRSGECDVVIAGGTDSARNAMGASTFWRMGALSTRNDDPAGASRPFDADRDGFVLGEGAGILVLERADHARARGALTHAALTGFGSTGDAHHPSAPHPEAEGATRALQRALAQAGLQPSDIDHVNAHGTSTPYNDSTEAAALRRVFGNCPPVTAVKSLIGHAIGGAGAIEAACCVLSLRHQYVPPTANLDRLGTDIDLDIVAKVPRQCRMKAVATTSFGFGGQNAALIFQEA
ncbi:beta-ketoacyl-[acyl-carrier-protein] synthase family protein [Streptomyces sp. NPDC057794]|uniref:beta-ketoacyl-[acyl-carrier-protein] synthase family protein n=1 Tax=Streptomyces sp. NPDC057794 TaxID=3346251 RepID=UPI003693F54A